MTKWLVAGVLAIGATIAIVLVLTRGESQEPDAVVESFRAGERTAISTFNTALRRQRANEIDEVELATIVERDVLVPWREVRKRVDAAPVPEARRELYAALRRYVENRQLAWEAYAAALRAATDEAARPHYDAYHQKNAEAQADAQVLGRMFREQGGS